MGTTFILGVVVLLTALSVVDMILTSDKNRRNRG